MLTKVKVYVILFGLLFVITLPALIQASPPAQATPPTFSKTFSPDTIGPGSVSTLQFTINNVDTVGVTDLAFTDILPAEGVVIATPSNATTTCTDGIVSAPDGGDTISLSDGQVEASADVNGDGLVGVADLIMVTNQVANLWGADRD